MQNWHQSFPHHFLTSLCSASIPHTYARHLRKPILRQLQTKSNKINYYSVEILRRFYVDNIWKSVFFIVIFIMNLANLQTKIPQHSLHIYTIYNTMLNGLVNNRFSIAKNILFSQLVAVLCSYFYTLHWNTTKLVSSERDYLQCKTEAQFNALALSKWLCEAFQYTFHSYFVVFFFLLLFCVMCCEKKSTPTPTPCYIYILIEINEAIPLLWALMYKVLRNLATQ